METEIHEITATMRVGLAHGFVGNAGKLKAASEALGAIGAFLYARLDWVRYPSSAALNKIRLSRFSTGLVAIDLRCPD